jgi:ankyrin repeat protein
MTVVEKGHLECLHALFVTNPLDDISRIQTDKDNLLEGSCSWIFGNMTYTEWLNSEESRVLLVHGGPGMGKTMITIAMVAELSTRLEQSDSSNSVLACFFCDNKDINRNNAVAILRSLLYQILCQQPKLFCHIQDEYKKQRSQLLNSRNALQTLWRILQNMLLQFKLNRVYIVVDALDECDPESRETLLRLMEVYTGKDKTRSTVGSATKWILTSRNNEVDINEAFINSPDISLENNSASVDHAVSRYIGWKVDILLEKKRYSEEQRDLVLKVLKEKAGGTFLWVSLACAELKKTFKTNGNIRRALDRLPRGLAEMYTQILDKAFADDASDGAEITKEILKAVLVAIRPLTLYELAVAANIPKEDWNDGSSLKEYVSQCRSLLTVRTDVERKNGRGVLIQNTTVHLVHQSAKDFLTSSKSKLFLSPELAEEHGNMARRSISYICSGVLANGPINLRDPKVIEPLASQSDDQSSTQDESEVSSDEGGSWRSPPEDEHAGNDNGPALEHVPDLETPTVLRYQMDNWMFHGRQASPNIGDLLDLYREFFEPNSDIRDSWSASCIFPSAEYQWRRMPDTFTPLQLGAYSGIYALVEKILDFNAEVQLSQPESLIDTRDSMGRTALMWAAEGGYEMVTKLLLERGAGVDVVNNNGDTALIIASCSGSKAVVQMLLNSGTFVNAQNHVGRTALLAASCWGHDEVVKLLLHHNADIEMSGKDSRTALWWGAQFGNEILVKLLLHHEARTDAQDIYGDTALIVAARGGHDTVVKILLQSKADVEQKDSDGRTALMRAVSRGRNKVIEILLQHETDIDRKDSHGFTALMIAALRGHDTVMKILLQQGADINSIDRRGFSILWHAAVRGYEEAVNILLEHGANLGTCRQEQEGDAISALCFAALKYSEAGIDNLFVRLEKIYRRWDNESPGPQSRCLSTTEVNRMHLATRKGYEASVEVLLEHGIEPDHTVVYQAEIDIHDDFEEWVFVSKNNMVANFLALIDCQQSVVRLLLHDRAKKLSKVEEIEEKDRATESRVGYRLAERLNHWKNPAWRSDSRDRLTLVSTKICLVKELTD